MSAFVLIAVGSLVPLVALVLAFACDTTRGREIEPDAAADVSGDEAADDARS